MPRLAVEELCSVASLFCLTQRGAAAGATGQQAALAAVQVAEADGDER